MAEGPPYALLIGRFQTFHDGHRWLIRQPLNAGKSVLLAVRDVERGPNNPKDPVDVVRDLQNEYLGEDVRVILIPDIQSVEYGRDVGYEVIEHEPPEDVGAISGTEIRAEARGKS